MNIKLINAFVMNRRHTVLVLNVTHNKCLNLWTAAQLMLWIPSFCLVICTNDCLTVLQWFPWKCVFGYIAKWIRGHIHTGSCQFSCELRTLRHSGPNHQIIFSLAIYATVWVCFQHTHTFSFLPLNWRPDPRVSNHLEVYLSFDFRGISGQRPVAPPWASMSDATLKFT